MATGTEPAGGRGRSRAGGRPGRGDLRRPLLPGVGPLAGTPPLVVFVVVVGLFAAGVLVGGPLGAAVLAVLVLGVLVLLVNTWSQLRPPARAARLLILAVLVAVTVAVALR